MITFCLKHRGGLCDEKKHWLSERSVYGHFRYISYTLFCIFDHFLNCSVKQNLCQTSFCTYAAKEVKENCHQVKYECHQAMWLHDLLSHCRRYNLMFMLFPLQTSTAPFCPSAEKMFPSLWDKHFRLYLNLTL